LEVPSPQCPRVYELPLFLKLPHPNPPLVKGRELIFPVSPLVKAGYGFYVNAIRDFQEINYPD